MNNQILEIAGMICIVGASFLLANKNVKEKEELGKEKELLNVEIETKNDIIKTMSRIQKSNNSNYLGKCKDIEKLKEDHLKEIKELHKTILFDNDVLTQTTEMLEQEKKQSKRLEKRIESNLVRASDCFAKDQITINKLEEMNKARYTETEYLRKKNSNTQHELCEANMENLNLTNKLELMVKRGNVKMDRARKLGGVR